MAEVSAMDTGAQQQVIYLHIAQQQLTRLEAALFSIEPVGLAPLREHCLEAYTSSTQQPNYCELKTKKSFPHGGSDPLDYIYIFKTEADPARSVPRHWHYVGFGLSDIHDYQYISNIDMKLRSSFSGDAQNYAQNRVPLVQLYPPSIEQVNGFGLELTFRIKCNSDEAWSQEPPKWPGLVMQALARYVYQSKNTFNVGDHMCWHCSLDGEENSAIEHILMTLDPQLKHAQTNLGRVTFVQLVGVCEDELEAARNCSARDILDIMRDQEETGGPLLVTDMQRQKTIFTLNPANRTRVDEIILESGSDMTRITAKHKTCARKPKWFIEAETIQNKDSDMEDDYDLSTDSTNPLAEPETKDEAIVPKGVERGNFHTMFREDTHLASQYNSNIVRTPSRMSYESGKALLFENLNQVNTRYYDNIYILLNYDTAKIFLAVLINRLAYKRPFTIGSFEGDMATIFVPEGAIVQSLVSPEQPYARNGILLQIYVPEDLRAQIVDTISPDFQHTVTWRNNYSWPEYKLHITIVDEIKD